MICLNEMKIAYSFKLSDDSSSNLGQDLEGKLRFALILLVRYKICLYIYVLLVVTCLRLDKNQ